MPFVDRNVLYLDTPVGRELTQYLGEDRAQALCKRLETAALEKNVDLVPNQEAFKLMLLEFMKMNDLG